jgi:hypothetical protein
MIDLKRYYRLHPQKLCWVEKANNIEYMILFKRFNNETGEELEQLEPQYFTLENLEENKSDLIIQLDTINSILEDIKKL